MCFRKSQATVRMLVHLVTRSHTVSRLWKPSSQVCRHSMEAYYAVHAQYAQELQNIRVGLDILDAVPEPHFYLHGAFGQLHEEALGRNCPMQELLCPSRPKKKEVDQDSQSPLYKTDEFRIFHFKVCPRQMAPTTLPTHILLVSQAGRR